MKVVVLDRDGVINQDSDDYVKSVDEWIPLPGSVDAIARLSQAGCYVAVATNQSGLARGYFTADTLAAMHQKMTGLVAAAGGKIDALVWCPHGPNEGCDCRKPLPGLVRQVLAPLPALAEGLGWMVGDSLRDLQAGAACQLRPVLVRTGKGERTLQNSADRLPPGCLICDDLAAAATLILQH